METNKTTKLSVAIVGGGIMGITTALELAKNGKCRVTLFEKETRLGGLSAAFSWNGLTWDRYYHVILSTDTQLIELLNELGLGEELFWKETKTGFFGKKRLVSLSSTTDFVTFPFLNLWQKFRMGVGIFYCTMLKDPAKLDRLYVRPWLTRVFGRQVYERIWEPLLRSKLGKARDRTSAAFIWATINRLYGARGSSRKVERMGHVHGGYARIIEKAEKALLSCGVEMHKGEEIREIVRNSARDKICVSTNSGEYQFDKVVMTINGPGILKTVQGRENHPYWVAMAKLKYIGVACVLLVLSRSLSPYYVINLLDKELPFTGIIEATNVVSPEELGGHHLVYLPKYMPQDDAMANLNDGELTLLFANHLKNVFPELKDEDIRHSLVFREPCVQALQELNSLKRKLTVQTPITGLYVINTPMILDSTLNNNAVITLAKQAVQQVCADATMLS